MVGTHPAELMTAATRTEQAWPLRRRPLPQARLRPLSSRRRDACSARKTCFTCAGKVQDTDQSRSRHSNSARGLTTTTLPRRKRRPCRIAPPPRLLSHSRSTVATVSCTAMLGALPKHTNCDQWLCHPQACALRSLQLCPDCGGQCMYTYAAQEAAERREQHSSGGGVRSPLVV